MESNALLDKVCAPSEDVVARDIAGELIIVPLASGIGDLEDELFTLNSTGQAIWRQMDGSNSLRQIAERLAEEYDAPVDKIEKDILGIADELLKRRIVAEA